MQPVPVCCNRPMWAVINRRTAVNAISRERNTPVWSCVDCGRILLRPENMVITADGTQFEITK